MNVREEVGHPQREGLAGFLVQAAGIKTADLDRGRVLAAGPGGGGHQATEADALGARAVVDPIGGRIDADAQGHRRRQVIDMAQLGDRAAISGQGDGATVHDPVEEPALDGVVVAGANDVGRAEAGEGDFFRRQPGLGVELAAVATLGIGRGGFTQRPHLAVGVDTGGAHVDEAMAGSPGHLDHGAAVGNRAPRAVDDHIKLTTRQSREPLGRAAVTTEVLNAGWNRVFAAGEQG